MRFITNETCWKGDTVSPLSAWLRHREEPQAESKTVRGATLQSMILQCTLLQCQIMDCFAFGSQ